MNKEITKTYKFFIKDKDNTLLNLAKETAKVYNLSKNTAIKEYKENEKTLSAFDIQKVIYSEFKNLNLSSDTKLAAIQQYTKARKTYFEAFKEFKKNPKKFNNNMPLSPTKDKEICAIFFKQGTIRHKNNNLLLSLKRGLEPLKFKWNKNLPLPCFVTISYKPSTGWQVACVIKNTLKIYDNFDKNKEMGVDLGIKRIATCFDGKNTLTFSGKLIKSNIRLKNKLKAKTDKKLDNCKKHSRRYKKIKQAQRKVGRRIKNKNTDIVKKYARYITNYCITNKIFKITIGDCSGIHKNTNLGKSNNQMITQFPEQLLKRYIEDMFKNAGGTTEVVPEPYTSKTCPNCGNITKPKNRDYICSHCDFKFDRDGVGSINIWNLSKKVSLDKISDVVGCLTQPRGIKYYSNTHYPQLSNS